MAITGGFKTAAALLRRSHGDGAPAAAATTRPAGGPEPLTEDELFEKYSARLDEFKQLYPGRNEAEYHKMLAEDARAAKEIAQTEQDAALAAKIAAEQPQCKIPAKAPSKRAAGATAQENDSDDSDEESVTQDVFTFGGKSYPTYQAMVDAKRARNRRVLFKSGLFEAKAAVDHSRLEEKREKAAARGLKRSKAPRADPGPRRKSSRLAGGKANPIYEGKAQEDDGDEDYLETEKDADYDSADDDEYEGKYNHRKNWRGKAKRSANKPYVPIPFEVRAAATSNLLAAVKKQHGGFKRAPSPYPFPVPKVTHVVPREKLSDHERRQLYDEIGEIRFVASGGESLDKYEAIGRAMDPPVTSRRGLRALRCIGEENLKGWDIDSLELCTFQCRNCTNPPISARNDAGGFRQRCLRQHEGCCRRTHEEETCPKCGQTARELGIDVKAFNLHKLNCISQAAWDTFVGELTIYYLDHLGEYANIGWRMHAGKPMYNVGIVQRTNRSLYSKTRRACGIKQKNGEYPVSGARADELTEKFGLEVSSYDASVFVPQSELKKKRKGHTVSGKNKGKK
ncbi:hypothetical protein ACHAXT_006285 [Thalassiosira profunda]